MCKLFILLYVNEHKDKKTPRTRQRKLKESMMLKKRAKLKVKSPRRQITRSRTNRSLLNRQRSFFLQNEFAGQPAILD
jgi:hypothetical protein